MLPGLTKGQAKMSKTNPDSAIYMDDDAETVNAKIKKAFCEGHFFVSLGRGRGRVRE